MKYLGEPNCTVIDYEKVKKVFQFDENGEFITEDEKIIKWMSKHKNFIKCENNTAESDEIFKCKKCDYETNNKGELLAHYKNFHKKTRGDRK
jgi:hypothetical protein